MKLLFKRSQVTGALSSSIFRLHAKFELPDSEGELIRKFGFHNAKLIKRDQPGLLHNSILLGLFCFTILLPITVFNFWREIGLGWAGVITISAILGFLAVFIACHQLRETIYVQDLIQGRYFKFRSVIELARKKPIWKRSLPISVKSWRRPGFGARHVL